jgi:hypothetical protein
MKNYYYLELYDMQDNTKIYRMYILDEEIDDVYKAKEYLRSNSMIRDTEFIAIIKKGKQSRENIISLGFEFVNIK